MADYLQSLGNSAASGLEAGVSGGVSGIVTGLIGAGLGAIAAKKQYNRQKTMMRMQHQFEQENMALQDEYQRKMLTDSASLQKAGLQNAGYNTADPDGTGTSAPTMSMPGTAAGITAPSSYVDIGDGGQTFSAIKSGQLSDSERRLNEIEERYRAALLEGKVGELNASIKQTLDTLPEQIDLLKAQATETLARADVDKKTVSQIDSTISKLEEETKNIHIDNKYKETRLDNENKKLAQEVALLCKENRIKEAEAKLADYGIIVGLDGISNLLSVTLSGNAGNVIHDLLSGIFSPLAAIPGAVGAFFKEFLSQIEDKLKFWK